MARRPRTLYEFVDPDELVADDPSATEATPSTTALPRRNRGGRIAACLALLTGTALFAVGVWQLRSPLRSAEPGRTAGFAHTVPGSVLPAARVRRARSHRARRRAPASRRSQGPHLTPQPRRVATEKAATAVRIAPVSVPGAVGVTPPPTYRPPVASRATTEFGFGR